MQEKFTFIVVGYNFFCCSFEGRESLKVQNIAHAIILSKKIAPQSLESDFSLSIAYNLSPIANSQ